MSNAHRERAGQGLAGLGRGLVVVREGVESQAVSGDPQTPAAMAVR